MINLYVFEFRTYEIVTVYFITKIKRNNKRSPINLYNINGDVYYIRTKIKRNSKRSPIIIFWHMEIITSSFIYLLFIFSFIELKSSSQGLLISANENKTKGYQIYAGNPREIIAILTAIYKYSIWSNVRAFLVDLTK